MRFATAHKLGCCPNVDLLQPLASGSPVCTSVHPCRPAACRRTHPAGLPPPCLPSCLHAHHPPSSLLPPALPPPTHCCPGSPGGARSRPRCRRRASCACSARLLLWLPHGRAAGGRGRGVQLLWSGKQSRGWSTPAVLPGGCGVWLSPVPLAAVSHWAKQGLWCGQSQFRRTRCAVH